MINALKGIEILGKFMTKDRNLTGIRVFYLESNLPEIKTSV
jgi:hypothetical protein